MNTVPIKYDLCQIQQDSSHEVTEGLFYTLQHHIGSALLFIESLEELYRKFKDTYNYLMIVYISLKILMRKRRNLKKIMSFQVNAFV